MNQWTHQGDALQTAVFLYVRQREMLKGEDVITKKKTGCPSACPNLLFPGIHFTASALIQEIQQRELF